MPAAASSGGATASPSGSLAFGYAPGGSATEGNSGGGAAAQPLNGAVSATSHWLAAAADANGAAAASATHLPPGTLPTAVGGSGAPFFGGAGASGACAVHAVHSRSGSFASQPQGGGGGAFLSGAASSQHSRTSSFSMPQAGDILLGHGSGAAGGGGSELPWLRGSSATGSSDCAPSPSLLGPEAPAAASGSAAAAAGGADAVKKVQSSVFDFLEEFDRPAAPPPGSDPAAPDAGPSPSSPALGGDAQSAEADDGYTPLLLPGQQPAASSSFSAHAGAAANAATNAAAGGGSAALAPAAGMGAIDGSIPSVPPSRRASQPGSEAGQPAGGAASLSGARLSKDPSVRDLELIATLPRSQVSWGLGRPLRLLLASVLFVFCSTMLPNIMCARCDAEWIVLYYNCKVDGPARFAYKVSIDPSMLLAACRDGSQCQLRVLQCCVEHLTLRLQAARSCISACAASIDLSVFHVARRTKSRSGSCARCSAALMT